MVGMDEDETRVVAPPAVRMNRADWAIVALHSVNGMIEGLSGSVQQLHSFLMMHSRAIDEAKQRKRFVKETRQDIERVM